MAFNSDSGTSEGILPARLATGSIVVLSLVFIAGSFKLGFEHMGAPGPGLMTFITGILLLPISLWLFVWPTSLSSTSFRLEPLAALVTIAIYGVLLPALGFMLPTFAIGAVWAVVFYKQSVTRAACLGIGLTVGAFLVFRLLLGVPLPLWPFGR